MPEAVIVDAIRTPIGRATKGSLKAVRADGLAAMPLHALVERNPQRDADLDRRRDDGLRLRRPRAGLQHRAGGATLLAGLDYHMPGCTVNRFCASSLQTMRMAFHAIKAGEGDTYIAAGVEAVSRAGREPPFEFQPRSSTAREGSLYNVYIPMGMTAENVAEQCSVSREAQDEWALISQTRAVAAQESGHFDKEIVGVTVPAHTDIDSEGDAIDVAATC